MNLVFHFSYKKKDCRRINQKQRKCNGWKYVWRKSQRLKLFVAENRKKKHQEQYKGEAYVWWRIKKQTRKLQRLKTKSRQLQRLTFFLAEIQQKNHENFKGGTYFWWRITKKTRKCKSGLYFWQKIKKIDPIKGGGAKKQQNQMKP